MENEQKLDLQPTFGHSLTNGLTVMTNNFLPLLVVVLVVGFIQMPIQIVRFVGEIVIKDGPLPFALTVLAVYLIFAFSYGFLFLSVFDYGSSFMFVKAVRGEKADFNNLVRGFRENYLDIVLANVAMFGLTMLGMVFFIIPGIIISCKLAFVKYLVMDKKMNAMEAIEESWRMTNGHAWTIFFLGFLSIFIIIFGLLMLIVGIIPAIQYISSVFASLYESVLAKNGIHTNTETVKPIEN